MPEATRQELMKVAINSVKKCDSFSLFWKYVEQAIQKYKFDITKAEAKQFEAEYSNQVYRKVRGGNLSINCNYVTNNYRSGGWK